MPGACPRGPNRGGAGMKFTKRQGVFSTIAQGGFNRPGIRPKIARLAADSVKDYRTPGGRPHRRERSSKSAF